MRSPIDGRRILVRHLAGLLLILAAAPAPAQEFRATVIGRVTDAQGGVLPGTEVTLTNLQTNVRSTVHASDAGRYVVPLVPPGAYRVMAARPGFRNFVREGVVLRTAERATVDIVFELGVAAEALTVTTELTGLSTTESAMAQTMDSKRVAELPLNGRQAYMLLQLTAGTLFTQRTFGGASGAFSGTRAWDTNGSVSIHGSRTGNNEFLIDGAPNSATGGWQYAPLVDAIEEFKVQAASVDASYGRTGGGIVNMTLKSGTSDLHGSASWFHRGDGLDANTTQNNRNAIALTGQDYNSVGVVLSGPIKRDKTFFMGYYEGFREQIPFPRTSTVPTLLQRAGDFSQTRNAAGQPITIYDPLTTRPDPSRPGRLLRDPFPGNKIPRERMSAVALELLSFIPESNVSGEPSTNANNLAVSPNTGRYAYDTYLVRIDHHFSSRHRLFASHSSNWGVEYRNQNGFPEPALRGNWPKHRNHYMGTVDDVLTLDASTILNTRVSFDRFNDFNPITYAALDHDLGIKTPYQTVSPQYPYITIDGYQDFFPSTFGQTANNIYSAQATLTKATSRHLLKAGVDVRAYRLNRVSLGDGNGRFDFTRGFTQRDAQSSDAISGNAFASFLLGFPGAGGVDTNATSARQYLYYAAFLQEDWDVTPRLTLNIGVRWDVQEPVTERFNRETVGFDAEAPNPFQAPGLPLRGGLVFADAQHRKPHRTDYSNIQPRLGLTYKLSSRSVLRGNYGRSYLPVTGSGQEGINQVGFGRRTSLIASVQTGIPFNTLERPFPEGILAAYNGSLGLATNVGSGLAFINPDFKTPYVDQWMAGLTLEPLPRTTLDLAYVGTRTRKLPINGRAINEVPRAEREKAIESLGGNTSYLSSQVPNPFAGLVPGTILNNATVSRGQLLRPYPQFQGITMDRVNEGYADYDALESTLKARPSRGVTAVVTYTLMRMTEATQYLNSGYDAGPSKSLAGNDRTHNLVITALWDLPFGKGQRLGAGANGLLGTLISGWQLNAIGEIRSGTPTVMPNGVLRQPSIALPPSEQTLERWFDNSTRTNPRPDGGYAWDVIPPNDFRTAPFRMADVRDPSPAQWSFSAFKNTRIRGRYNLQLRAEVFNATNTPMYAGPDTGVSSPTFGRITPDQINFPRQVQFGMRLAF